MLAARIWYRAEIMMTKKKGLKGIFFVVFKLEFVGFWNFLFWVRKVNCDNNTATVLQLMIAYENI